MALPTNRSTWPSSDPFTPLKVPQHRSSPHVVVLPSTGCHSPHCSRHSSKLCVILFMSSHFPAFLESFPSTNFAFVAEVRRNRVVFFPSGQVGTTAELVDLGELIPDYLAPVHHLDPLYLSPTLFRPRTTVATPSSLELAVVASPPRSTPCSLKDSTPSPHLHRARAIATPSSSSPCA